MEDTQVIVFDPKSFKPQNEKILTDAVKLTSKIKATDLTDKSQLAVVRQNRIALKNARVAIQKRGRELREGATAYNRAVIAEQDRLVGIIEPEEERLAKIEAEAEKLAILEERKAKLPERVKRIADIGLTQEDGKPFAIDEAYILTLDDAAFDGFYNNQVAHHNQMVAAKLAAEQKKIDDEKAEKQRKIDAAAAEKKRKEDLKAAEKAGREKAEREAKEKADREAKEAAEKKERDEAAAKAAAEKLEKDKAYKAFLAKHGITKESVNGGGHKIFDEGHQVVVYLFLDKFTK